MLKLEVIAFNLESCITIQESGAHRIELCDNPAEGGTTPSFGFITTAREKVGVELFPIIRPRGGDFCYTDDEFEIMRQDVKLCRELLCDGIVTGLLNTDGTVDKDRTRRLVDIAYPMDVTFHRAFDRVADPVQALEDIISCGCTRLLTSGLHPTAVEGRDVLKELVRQADSRIVIMPGSGIRSTNIAELGRYTGAEEFHTSARVSKSSVSHPQALMQEAMYHVVADQQEIRRCLDELANSTTAG